MNNDTIRPKNICVALGLTLVLLCFIVSSYDRTETRYNTLWSSRHPYGSVTRTKSIQRSNGNNENSNMEKKNKNKKAIPQPPATAKLISTTFLPWNITVDATTAETRQILPDLHSIQTIYQYYRQHGVEAWQRDPSIEDRKFAVAFLPCRRHLDASSLPVESFDEVDSTIEVIHNFFNTLVWSILTNRTVIVQWYNPVLFTTHQPGRTTIHRDERNYTCATDRYKNSPPTLQSYPQPNAFQLASWLVQWEDILRLNAVLYDEAIVPVPIDVYRQSYDTQHTIVVFPQIPSIQYQVSMKRPDDAFFHNTWSDHPLDRTNGIQYIKNMNEWNRHTTLQLYYEGSDFLYGALFRICFPYYDMQNKIAPTPKTNSIVSEHIQATSLSFALLTVADNSNTGDTDDGSDDGADNNDDGNAKINIDAEIKCLRHLLPLKSDKKSSSCKIVVLSTNSIIVDRITDWIASSKRQCTVMPSLPIQSSTNDDDTKVNHPETITPSNTDGNNEDDNSITDSIDHGKRNSMIPLRDLVVAANVARTGVIGPHNHPAFQLLVEWIEYNRQMEEADRILDHSQLHPNLFLRRRRRQLQQHYHHTKHDRRMTSIATSANSTLPPLLWCESSH